MSHERNDSLGFLIRPFNERPRGADFPVSFYKVDPTMRFIVFYSRNSKFVNKNHIARTRQNGFAKCEGMQIENERAGSGGQLSPSLRDTSDRFRKLKTRLFQALSHGSWRGGIADSTNVRDSQCRHCIPIFIQNRTANVDDSFDLITLLLLISSQLNGG